MSDPRQAYRFKNRPQDTLEGITPTTSYFNWGWGIYNVSQPIRLRGKQAKEKNKISALFKEKIGHVLCLRENQDVISRINRMYALF